jgi:hypothetical protein
VKLVISDAHGGLKAEGGDREDPQGLLAALRHRPASMAD